MSTYKVTDTELASIADAIRAKTGDNSAITFPAGFVSEISAITTGDTIDHEDLPTYVKKEVSSVVSRVNAHLQNDSIVVLAVSDSHQSTTANVEDGNLHAGMALKALAYSLPVTFACHLGDYTAGSSTTTISEGLGHFASINADIDEAFRGLPQFRTVGNHDPLGYSYSQNGRSLTQAELYALIGKYNEDSGATMGSTTAGYCYRDFPTKSLRVICLNSADVASPTSGAEALSGAQQTWFADTLISTPQGYGIIVLAHHPLDWGGIMIGSHILRAYVEEHASMTINGTTYSFTGKNKSAWVLQLHGHVHTLKNDKLHWNNSGTGVEYDVYRMSVPNSCFVRNNEYGASPVYYGIAFGTSTTWSKTANTASDTACTVFVFNPSEKKAYAVNYGAGIDRELFWGDVSIPVTGVSLNASSGTLYPAGTVTLTATVTPSDATNKALTWTSSNTTVATVNNGVVTALAVGSATITVTTQDGGYTASYALTVEAVPRGNLMPTVGYFDDTRRKSDGSTAADAGIVSTGFIDIITDVSYPATIRIKGAEFRTSKAWQANMISFPSTQTGGTAASIADGGSGPNVLSGSTMTVSSDGTEVVLTLPTRNTSHPYLVFNAKGSGANLELYINEPFPTT